MNDGLALGHHGCRHDISLRLRRHVYAHPPTPIDQLGVLPRHLDCAVIGSPRTLIHFDRLLLSESLAG